MPRAGFLRTTIGQKIVMAVTGLIMIGFVIGHVLGNLLVFRGATALNEYSAFLKSTGGLLWTVRAVLLVSVLAHIWAAVSLTRRKVHARPVGYAERDPQVSTWAARTIRWGGALLLIFIVLHLLHFTFGIWRPAPFSRTDVYGNVVGSFRVWWVSLFYVVAMIALGLHLYHGTWASLRTLGASPASPRPLRRPIVAALALLIWLGFTSIPVAVFFGLIP